MAELAIMAATGLGASAGTAATIGTVANIGMTAASAFGQIVGGNREAQAMELQSQQALLNARMEKLEGRRQASNIQRQLDRDLSSQNAIFAARGALQGEGSALAAQETSRVNASRDIDMARFNTDIASLSAQQRASNARANASAARTQGLYNAIGTVADYRSYSAPRKSLLEP